MSPRETFTRVVVLYGGLSAEAEISVVSVEVVGDEGAGCGDWTGPEGHEPGDAAGDGRAPGVEPA
ncbi:MAG: hypothetical protein ACKN9G_03595, partial [Candidatus Limnocylindrus sp.]